MRSREKTSVTFQESETVELKLDYAESIYLAETPEEFVVRCREALEEPPDSPKRTARIEAARRNSWDEKVKEMKEILAW